MKTFVSAERDSAVEVSGPSYIDSNNVTDTDITRFATHSYPGHRSFAEMIFIEKYTTKPPLLYQVMSLVKPGTALLYIEKDGNRVLNIYDGNNAVKYEPNVKVFSGPSNKSWIVAQLEITKGRKFAQSRIKTRLGNLKRRRNAQYELEIERTMLDDDD